MNDFPTCEIGDLDGYYLAFPGLPKRPPWPDVRRQWPRNHPWSRWYRGVDIPPASYWHHIIRAGWESEVFVGETIELVNLVTLKHEYLGIPYFQSTCQVLRRVRLETPDRYVDLYQSDYYRLALVEKRLDPGGVLLG